MTELTQDLTFENFRAEMQRRLCQFALTAPEVREMLEFAQGHSDPKFLAMAMDKYQRQAQFAHDWRDPTWMDRIIGVLTVAGWVLGNSTIRPFLICAAMIGCYETAKVWFAPSQQQESVTDQELEELARQLGIDTGDPVHEGTLGTTSDDQEQSIQSKSRPRSSSSDRSVSPTPARSIHPKQHSRLKDEIRKRVSMIAKQKQLASAEAKATKINSSVDSGGTIDETDFVQVASEVDTGSDSTQTTDLSQAEPLTRGSRTTDESENRPQPQTVEDPRMDWLRVHPNHGRNEMDATGVAP